MGALESTTTASVRGPRSGSARVTPRGTPSSRTTISWGVRSWTGATPFSSVTVTVTVRVRAWGSTAVSWRHAESRASSIACGRLLVSFRTAPYDDYRSSSFARQRSATDAIERIQGHRHYDQRFGGARTARGRLGTRGLPAA